MSDNLIMLKMKCKQLLPPALLLVANFFIFGPLSILQGNANEFRFGTLDLMLPLLLACFGALSFLLIIGLIISEEKSAIYNALLMSIGVLLWAQGNFLVWDYGVLDGSSIDWSKYLWQGWLDLGIWFLVIFLALYFCQKLRAATYLITISLIITQTVALALGHRHEPTKEISIVEDESESGYHISSSFNIVHIILDSFRTEAFVELIQEEGIADKFQGFTLFEENMAVARMTTIAIPSIFMGKAYDGSVGLQDFSEEAAMKGFSSILYANGYNVNFFPNLPMRNYKYTNYHDLTGMASMPIDTHRRHSAIYLLDVALFRQIPHFLKKTVYSNNNWFLTRLFSESPNSKSFQDKAFFERYIQHLVIAGTNPAYHFIHLHPPHPPYVTSRDGKYTRDVLPNTKENYKNEARQILKIFCNFLDKLNELGVFDSSLIVLQGDHGSHYPIQPKDPAADPVTDSRYDPRRISRLSPLLAVKPPGAAGPIKISPAQTMVTDIAPTIMEFAGYNFPGTSVFRLAPSSPRTRIYRDYTGIDPGKFKTFQYTIEGSIYSSKSLIKIEQIPVFKYKTTGTPQIKN